MLRLIPLVLFMAMASAPAKPNVLLIAIDDLNDWVGCLGGHPQAETPNIDRLAARGTLFTNAHCQAPICNPSRTSIMLGLRPSTTGIYDNAPRHWTVPKWKGAVTLPRHFAASGYLTLTAGKIYHVSGMPRGDFEVLGPRPGQRNRKLDVHHRKELKPIWDFGPQEYPEEQFGDHRVASWAVEQLAAEHERPFFMAVGFYRPHVPWYAPPRLFDALPDKLALPPVKDDDRADLSKAAIDLIANPTPPPHSWFLEGNRWQEAVRAFTASTRFTDEQLGRVLDALDAGPHADDTIVVLYSDHGFHLGEKQMWAKRTLWERSTRVPLIISVPGAKPATCSQPAELLSIYPTLVELCDLPGRELDGVSLGPLLKDMGADWPHAAITTFKAGNHSVRTEHHRYIRYADGSEELYDHRSDPNEWENLAERPRSGLVIRRMKRHLP